MPPQEMLVHRFLNGLKAIPKYREYKSVRSNSFASSKPFPDSISKLCEELSAYVPIAAASTSVKTSAETAFAAVESKKKKKCGEQKKRPAGEPKDKKSAAGSSTEATNEDGEVICHRCHKPGHYARGCVQKPAPKHKSEAKVNMVIAATKTICTVHIAVPVSDDGDRSPYVSNRPAHGKVQSHDNVNVDVNYT